MRMYIVRYTHVKTELGSLLKTENDMMLQPKDDYTKPNHHLNVPKVKND